MTKTGNSGLGMIGNVDLSNVMRGRSFPVERTERLLETGLPWVPANVMLSPCNSLPADNPFGPVGETKLVAIDRDPLFLPAKDDIPQMALYLAEIQTHDRRPWHICPRTCLRDALAKLEAEFGLTVKVGLEHEFYISGLDGAPSPAFSVEGSRSISGLSEAVHNVLKPAGAELEQFAAEFGHYQFEIAGTVKPALEAIDNAIYALAAIRDVMSRNQLHATFAPKPHADGPGSGVHLHFSLWEGAVPLTATRDQLTNRAGSFVSGLLANLDTIMACSISNPNSYDRLTPSSWVGVFPCFGARNREAAIRLCPRSPDAQGVNRNASIEFRLADATANPYLTLAALVHAGMDGLRKDLDAPQDIGVDPATMTVEERNELGLTTLPSSPAETLRKATSLGIWFGEDLRAALLSVRRNDIADAERLGEDYLPSMILAV